MKGNFVVQVAEAANAIQWNFQRTVNGKEQKDLTTVTLAFRGSNFYFLSKSPRDSPMDSFPCGHQMTVIHRMLHLFFRQYWSTLEYKRGIFGFVETILKAYFEASKWKDFYDLSVVLASWAFWSLTIGTFAVDDQGSQDITHKFFEAAVYHIACSRLFTPDQGAIRRAIFVNNAGMNYLAIQSFEKAEPAYVEAIHLGIFEQDKPL
jgi:hypothetical protein